MGRGRRHRYDELPALSPSSGKNLPSYEVSRVSRLLTRLLQSIRQGDEVDLRRLGRVQADVREGFIRCADVGWVKGLLERYGIG
jgi:hypothetical protein